MEVVRRRTNGINERITPIFRWAIGSLGSIILGLIAGALLFPFEYSEIYFTKCLVLLLVTIIFFFIVFLYSFARGTDSIADGLSKSFKELARAIERERTNPNRKRSHYELVECFSVVLVV